MSKMNPEYFFGSVLPEQLGRAKGKLKSKGTLLVRLTGDDPGEWTIELHKGKVRPGGIESPDATIEALSQDFVKVISGGGPVGGIPGKVEGNQELLAEWAEVMSAAG